MAQNLTPPPSPLNVPSSFGGQPADGSFNLSIPMSAFSGLHPVVQKGLQVLQQATQPFSGYDQPPMGGITRMSIPHSKTDVALGAASLLPWGRLTALLGRSAKVAEPLSEAASGEPDPFAPPPPLPGEPPAPFEEAHEAYVGALREGAKPEEAEKIRNNIIQNSDYARFHYARWDANTIGGKLRSGAIDLNNPPEGTKVTEKQIEKIIGKPPTLPEPPAKEITSGDQSSVAPVPAAAPKEVTAGGPDIRLKEFHTNRGGFASPARLVLTSPKKLTADDITKNFFQGHNLSVVPREPSIFTSQGDPNTQLFDVQFHAPGGAHISVPEGVEESLGIPRGQSFTDQPLTGRAKSLKGKQ